MTTADKLRRITMLERRRKPAQQERLQIFLVGIDPITMAEACRVPIAWGKNNVSSR